jgi:hypothetical protein
LACTYVIQAYTFLLGAKDLANPVADQENLNMYELMNIIWILTCKRKKNHHGMPKNLISVIQEMKLE